MDECKNAKHIRLLYLSYLSKKDKASWEDGAGGAGAGERCCGVMEELGVYRKGF